MSLVASLLAAEAVLRTDYFLYDSDFRVFEKTHELQETDFFRLTGDPRLPYRLAPGASRTFWWGARIATNQQGALGDATSSPDHLNLLIAGDSVAFGLGVAHEESFPELLRQRIPNARIAVLAAPGYNTSHEVEWIARVLEARTFEPDVVILQFGPNDYLSPDRIVERERHEFFQRIRTRTLGRARGPYAWALDHSELFFRANHALTAALAGRVPLHERPDRGAVFAGALDRLVRLSTERGFRLVVVAVPYAFREEPETAFLAACAPVLERLPDAVDLTGDLEGKPGFWFDRMHPNAAGHRRIAERLLASLPPGNQIGNGRIGHGP